MARGSELDDAVTAGQCFRHEVLSPPEGVDIEDVELAVREPRLFVVEGEEDLAREVVGDYEW